MDTRTCCDEADLVVRPCLLEGVAPKDAVARVVNVRDAQKSSRRVRILLRADVPRSQGVLGDGEAGDHAYAGLAFRA